MTAIGTTPHSTSGRLERFLEAERDVWLRRRFLFFCACGIVLLAVNLLLSPDLIATAIGESGAKRQAALVSLGDSFAYVATNLAAFFYVRRRQPQRGMLLGLAFWLTGGLGSLNLLLLRVQLGLDPGALGAAGLPASPHLLWLIIGLPSVVINFTLASMLIPWTWREALRPALLQMATAACIVVFDAGMGQRLAPGALALTGMTFALLPGMGVCWLRFSRFRKRMQLRFESLSYRRLRAELSEARRIHESCFPPPRLRRPVAFQYAYEPMDSIGGDTLFVHTRDAEGAVLSAIVLDVTGHGIAAALTVNRVLGEVERIFAEHPEWDPAQVLATLNRYFHLTLSRHQIYATAVCFRVDAARGVLQWANGGHPPPVILRHGGRETQTLNASDAMLGIFDGADFQPAAQEAPLGPGDVVIAYTDGASEAVDANDAPLGCDGICLLARRAAEAGGPPEAWPGTILRAIQARRSGPPDDDTLVVALYRPIS